MKFKYKTIFISSFIVLFFSLIGGTYLFYGNFDTVYAHRYSHSNFNNIVYGMTKKEVTDLIGEPISSSQLLNDEAKEVWVFSKQGEDKKANYFERFVYFDESGKVHRVEKSLYID